MFLWLKFTINKPLNLDIYNKGSFRKEAFFMRLAVNLTQYKID